MGARVRVPGCRDPGGRQVIAPMGWCLTGHHSSCRVAYVTDAGENRKCVCDCHANNN